MSWYQYNHVKNHLKIDKLSSKILSLRFKSISNDLVIRWRSTTFEKFVCFNNTISTKTLSVACLNFSCWYSWKDIIWLNHQTFLWIVLDVIYNIRQFNSNNIWKNKRHDTSNYDIRSKLPSNRILMWIVLFAYGITNCV